MAAQPGYEPQFSDNESIESTITYEEERALKLAEALDYIKSVKAALGDRRQAFRDFLDMFTEFGQKRLSMAQVTDRVKLLLSGHRELLQGFNQYLPEGYEIALPPPRRSDLEFENAVAYVHKVESAFSQERERYVSFLRVLNEFRRSERSMLESSQKMCDLLWDRQDLLEGFSYYVPDWLKPTFEHAMNKVAKDKATTT